MDIERRALNEDERAEFASTALWEVDWKELVGIAALNGGSLSLLVLLVAAVVAKLIGIDTTWFMGLSDNSLMLLAFGIGASSFVAYVVGFELRSQKNSIVRRQHILGRNDLVVETHSIVDCKLVREPEHGQCMFFVKSYDENVMFVFEGQDLQEGWEESPLLLSESDRPRRNLKIVRLPETRESIFVKFYGPEIPLHACFEMALGPNSWPSSGKVLKSSWDDLERRYRLKTLKT